MRTYADAWAWTMTFAPDGSLICDTCGDTCPSGTDPEATMALAFFKGWGVFVGTSGSGEPVEHIACRGCRRETRKRPLRTEQGFEDTPMF